MFREACLAAQQEAASAPGGSLVTGRRQGFRLDGRKCVAAAGRVAARGRCWRVLCRSVMAVGRRHPSLLEPLTAATIAAAAVQEPQRAATHVGRAAAHTPRRPDDGGSRETRQCRQGVSECCLLLVPEEQLCSPGFLSRISGGAVECPSART